ncbi:IS4/Tn5 family transposase DNA-binding protein, partial [Paraburkholderia aspalathi]
GIDLGDERRNDRAKRVLMRFAEKPTQSIVGASQGWPETMAAYRFVGNASFGWHDIMQPHWQRTRERMSKESVVLCVDDTTELDFNGQEIEGLGPLNDETRRGMYLHPTYALSPERVPPGVLNAWMWSRKPKAPDGGRDDIKESTRWIEGYERVAELAAELPGTRLVYVADREADIAALMRPAVAPGTPVDWLIRSTHNRSLDGGEK